MFQAILTLGVVKKTNIMEYIGKLIVEGSIDMSVIMKKYHGLGNDYLVLDPNKNIIKLKS